MPPQPRPSRHRCTRYPPSRARATAAGTRLRLRTQPGSDLWNAIERRGCGVRTDEALHEQAVDVCLEHAFAEEHQHRVCRLGRDTAAWSTRSAKQSQGPRDGWVASLPSHRRDAAGGIGAALERSRAVDDCSLAVGADARQLRSRLRRRVRAHRHEQRGVPLPAAGLGAAARLDAAGALRCRARADVAVVLEAAARYLSTKNRSAATTLSSAVLTVTEPPPGLLVPLSGILASRRRKPRKNEKKRGKNGRDTA